MKKTAARRAVDKAAGACGKAWEALRELSEFVPDGATDRYLLQLREMREWAEYLETCTWPDER